MIQEIQDPGYRNKHTARTNYKLKDNRSHYVYSYIYYGKIIYENGYVGTYLVIREYIYI